MNWNDAVEAMRRGAQVRRVSEAVRRQEGAVNGVPVVSMGEEPLELVQGWCTDLAPALVFSGAWSHVLWRPLPEHLAATDWIEVPR